jgi:hypothetical protein
MKVQLESLLETTKDVLSQLIKRGTLVATESETSQRLTICQSCEYRTETKCNKCGCNLLIKTRLQAAKCPLKKW